MGYSGILQLVLCLLKGDSGKGKIADFLAKLAKMVVRPTGGANAGHTLIVGDHQQVNHLMPCGSLHEGVLNHLGHGVAIDVVQLWAEIEAHYTRFNAYPLLSIDPRAPLVLPTHKMLDAMDEELKKKEGVPIVGTTKQGIGPLYADVARRKTVAIGDFNKPDFERKVKKVIFGHHNQLIAGYYGHHPYPGGEKLKEFLDCVAKVMKVVDISRGSYEVVTDALKEGDVVVEGAQGYSIGLYTGDPPNVTSSDPNPPGIAQSLHLPLQLFSNARIIGCIKAYSSAVGTGGLIGEFFPEVEGKYTEEHGLAYELQRIGKEFGATTGRPRRIALMYLKGLATAIEECGVTEIALTHIDCFNGMAKFPVIDSVNPDGTQNIKELEWGITIDRSWRKPSDLPKPVIDILRYIYDETGIPVTILSIGPDRDETIVIPRNLVQVLDHHAKEDRVRA